MTLRQTIKLESTGGDVADSASHYLTVWPRYKPNCQQLGAFLLKTHHLPHTPTHTSRNISTKYTNITSACSAVMHIWQRVGLPSPTLLYILA